MKKTKDHTFYMQQALAQANNAFKKDEVPVGAIIVDQNGTIIARSYNKVMSRKSQTAHAELLAISQAGKKTGDWRLDGCSIYVTLEPCAMCMNAIILSRLSDLIFGASSPLFGYNSVDKESPYWLYKKDALAISEGICKEKSISLLQQFFKNKRMKSE